MKNADYVLRLEFPNCVSAIFHSSLFTFHSSLFTKRITRSPPLCRARYRPMI